MVDGQLIEAGHAAAFWDAYFENRFIELTRTDAGCAGRARLLPSGGPAGLTGKPQLQDIACSRALLAAYDTTADGRFSLLPPRPPEAGDALRGMMDRSYPYRDAAPFGKARMAEYLRQCSRMLDGRVSIATLQALLVRLVAIPDALNDALIAALAFLLGELRDPSSGEALLAVIRNSAGVPYARRVIHFSAVSAAFSAAWKCDARSMTPDLLVLMEHADGSARQRIASLFERLYSTRDLESLHRHGEAWMTAAFWSERLAPLLEPARWSDLDATNLFWELRLSVISRLGSGHAGLLRMLSADEVGVVREAAAARLALLAGPSAPQRRQ